MNIILNIKNIHTIISLIHKNIYKILKIYLNKLKINLFLINYLKFSKIKILYKNKNFFKKNKNIICKLNYKLNLYKIKNIIKKKNKKILFIGLYELTDINNIGSCLRTINGAGGDGLIIFKKKIKIDPKILDISLGSITPIIIKKNFFKEIINLKKKGIVIICTDENSKLNLFKNTNLKRNILFLIGNEKNGIKNKFIKNLCDHTISIPMYGNIKNLNVSTVSTICLYEAIRQRNYEK